VRKTCRRYSSFCTDDCHAQQTLSVHARSLCGRLGLARCALGEIGCTERAAVLDQSHHGHALPGVRHHTRSRCADARSRMGGYADQSLRIARAAADGRCSGLDCDRRVGQERFFLPRVSSNGTSDFDTGYCHCAHCAGGRQLDMEFLQRILICKRT